ncbi:hypothetical protein F4823DRAFT_562281 [Ustulina deusta]|nr:hypothetical protein F4823DRAFT_562281 [Ustulina deusta]
MADNGNKKWSEAEKTQFLMEAIGQMQSAGAKVNFSLFTLPGRTPKSLSHLWTKINNDNAAYVAQLAAKRAEAGGGTTPTPKRRGANGTPGSRKRTAQAAAKDGDGHDGNELPATPSKRPRKTNAKAKAKGEAAQATTQPVKGEEPEESKPETDLSSLYGGDGDV